MRDQCKVAWGVVLVIVLTGSFGGGPLLAVQAKAPARAYDAARALADYRGELDAFRAEFGGSRELPAVPFFLFGMGAREKLLYRDGRLLRVKSGEVARKWDVTATRIVPPDYRVEIDTANGRRVVIAEDEAAVWVEEDGRRTALAGTDRPVKLPDFAGRRYARVLRVLHQELLYNVTAAGPLPNLFVYDRPWYRDAAMMALAFRATGNLEVIREWVLNLREPFDRNNAGETEVDNLGQALFLVSLVSDRDHPLVAKVLAEVPRFEVRGDGGKFIRGRSDFAEHPAYQTKWLKYGLRALKLPDGYAVPAVEDGYSALFWMDYRDSYVKTKDADDRGSYPYLGWACDHFHGAKKSPIGDRDYPLTWEADASQARYEGMRVIDPAYVEKKLAAPHTWHAAEVFLYLLAERPRHAE